MNGYSAFNHQKQYSSNATLTIGDWAQQKTASRPRRKPSILNRANLVLNGGSGANRKARRLVLAGLQAGLDAVEPYGCVRYHLKIVGRKLLVGRSSYDLSRVHRIFLLAVGKASLGMAEAASHILEDCSTEGMVIAPKGQMAFAVDKRFKVFLTGHPVPDREGLRASQLVIHKIKAMRTDELLLCLISGGASALLPSPSDRIQLRDKNRLTELLMRSGASIHEINTVRRHISNLKGGKLVDLCPASTILSLLISDVPGNQLHDIGSGLTVEDPTTYHDAVAVLKRRKIWHRSPTQIKSHLLKGVNGMIPETPKPGRSSFSRVHNFIIADNATACEAIHRRLGRAGIASKILSTSVEIDARALGRSLASMARRLRTRPRRGSSCRGVIVGGETTVRLAGNGKGGRNQEVALAAVSDIAGFAGTAIAAIGTDGVDGNSDAAGAIIDGNTFLLRQEEAARP